MESLSGAVTTFSKAKLSSTINFPIVRLLIYGVSFVSMAQKKAVFTIAHLKHHGITQTIK